MIHLLRSFCLMSQSKLYATRVAAMHGKRTSRSSWPKCVTSPTEDSPILVDEPKSVILGAEAASALALRDMIDIVLEQVERKDIGSSPEKFTPQSSKDNDPSSFIGAIVDELLGNSIARMDAAHFTQLKHPISNNLCHSFFHSRSQALRLAVGMLGLAQHGIPPARVGSHSLRAGGAMALSFAGAGSIRIKKFGRWSSDTFLMYIHDQIMEYSEDWANKMSIPRTFNNIEGAFTNPPGSHTGT